MELKLHDIHTINGNKTAEPELSEGSQIPVVDWDEGNPAALNYRKLGRQLGSCGDLFRQSGHDGGLLLVRSDGSTKSVRASADLAPIIVDRILLTGSKPTTRSRCCGPLRGPQPSGL